MRRNHGAGTALRVVSSRVFVIGGQDAAGTVLSTVEEYTAQAVTLVATPHTSLPAARARFGIASILSTNQIYVMGGVDSTGADQTAIFELSVATNGPVAGPAGTPSGALVTRGNLSGARSGLQVSNPPGVTNFLTARSGGRDDRQDARGPHKGTVAQLEGLCRNHVHSRVTVAPSVGSRCSRRGTARSPCSRRS